MWERLFGCAPPEYLELGRLPFSPAPSRARFSEQMAAADSDEADNMEFNIHFLGASRFQNREGEMATMGHHGTVGQESDESTDGRPAWGTQHGFLHSAWVQQGRRDDVGESQETGIQSTLDLAAAHKIVSDDFKLTTSLWATLPKELILLVLARLPVPEISRLRCLSTELKTGMAAVHSEFNQACDEANPKMIALLSNTNIHSRFWVRIFDLNKRRWYAYLFRIENGDNRVWRMMDALDGGLVCFVSNPKLGKARVLHIVVMNPLTRVQRRLPPLLGLGSVRPSMVQIIVDCETKCYKVIVVGTNEGLVTAEVYDSRLNQWTAAAQSCGSTFGRAFNWSTGAYKRDAVPCVYNVTEGLQELPLIKPDVSEGRSLKTCLVGKDRAYVLYEPIHKRCSKKHCRKLKRSKDYSITEYQAHNNAKRWVEVKTFIISRGIGCTPLERPRRGLYMHVCEGFVMILTYRDIPVMFPLEHEVACILDLSTGEWRELLKCPLMDQPSQVDHYILQVYWNVIP